MLTVAKVTGGAAVGYADYLAGKTQNASLGDYYLNDGERVEAPGRWVTGAVAVGCDAGRNVHGEQLRALMAVKHPSTGEQLRPVGASGEAVAALDATFSAPKSVSAIWALAQPQLRGAIELAHELAVDRAIGHSLRQVAMVRRRVSPTTVVHEPAKDVIATSWRHTTARAVDGRAPDPQLHSHVLLHGALRADGRVVAIDSRAWMVHRREIGAAYRTELAHELALLGFEIQRGTGRGGRYFEIEGVPQELLDRWSGRGRQIEEAIGQRLDTRPVVHTGGRVGRLSPAEDRRLRVSTRSGKQPVTTAELDRDWDQDARRIGFGTRDVHALRDTGRSTPAAVRTAELVQALTEFDATFTERELRAVALERSAGAPASQALETVGRARAFGEVLQLADGRFTTYRHRTMERHVIQASENLAEMTPEAVDPDHVRQAEVSIGQRLAEHGARLSPEQAQALRLATGERQVVMIEGQAGTGKSTVLQAVALAHQTNGRQILVTSTGALAAQRLANELHEIGVDAPSYSTVALAQAIYSGQVTLGPRTTVIHDEAALASTREQHQLHQAVGESGARLVIVGDPQQSQPVGAGGLWARLEQIADNSNARVELTQNVRSRAPEDRRDQRLFRDGQAVDALHGYNKRDRIHISADQRSAEQSAVNAADSDRRSGLRTIVIAQTSNDHLDQLNAQAQALRLGAGDLGADALPVPGRPYGLRAGDEVQIRHSVNHPEHGQLRNGTTATVRKIDRRAASVTLSTTNGNVTLDRDQVAKADIRLAYVQHPFPAQGSTTDTAHLIAAEHTAREGTYVAITRARESTHIYASSERLAADQGQDQITRLATLLSRYEPEIPSIATPLAELTRETFTERLARRQPVESREQEVLEITLEHDHGWEP